MQASTGLDVEVPPVVDRMALWILAPLGRCWSGVESDLR